MPKSRLTLIGYEEVKKDFTTFLTSGNKTKDEYLDFIGDAAVRLLSANTPIATGDLASSWTVLERNHDYVVVGVPDEKEDNLQALIFGTGPSPGPYVPALGRRVFKKANGEPITSSDTNLQHPGIVKNDFVFRIQDQINGLMAGTMIGVMYKGHKFYRGFDTKADRGNLLKITGLTGVRGNKRRGLGRTSFSVRTGRKSLRVRIGRRRRVMNTNYIKNVKLG